MVTNLRLTVESLVEADPPGTTTEAVMSSSVWTFAAGEKSGRSDSSLQAPSSSNPTRSMLTLMVSPSSRSWLDLRPLTTPTEKWLRQSPFQPGW